MKQEKELQELYYLMDRLANLDHYSTPEAISSFIQLIHQWWLNDEKTHRGFSEWRLNRPNIKPSWSALPKKLPDHFSKIQQDLLIEACKHIEPSNPFLDKHDVRLLLIEDSDTDRRGE